MRTRIAAACAGAAILLVGMVSSIAASNPNCLAQFTTALAAVERPFGQTIVVPEVRNLTIGGPNLGQEVKVVFATADRTDCPVTPE